MFDREYLLDGESITPFQITQIFQWIKLHRIQIINKMSFVRPVSRCMQRSSLFAQYNTCKSIFNLHFNIDAMVGSFGIGGKWNRFHCVLRTVYYCFIVICLLLFVIGEFIIVLCVFIRREKKATIQQQQGDPWKIFDTMKINMSNFNEIEQQTHTHTAVKRTCNYSIDSWKCPAPIYIRFRRKLKKLT